MDICQVRDLKPHDRFIWGNRETRKIMCVSGDNLGPLVFVGREDCSHPEMFMIIFRDFDGVESTRVASNHSRFIRFVDDSEVVDHRVRCERCDCTYGQHGGLLCPPDVPKTIDRHASFPWFVPSDDDLAELFDSDVDFFSGLGL